MTASPRTRGRFQGMWGVVGRALAALGPTRAEQILMQEAWWQANRAAGPGTGPLAWALTLDGYRLAGSHLPTPSDTGTMGTRRSRGPRAGRPVTAPAYYLGRPAPPPYARPRWLSGGAP